MIMLRRTVSVFFFLLCLTFFLPHSVYAAISSPEITREEWSSFLQQSTALKTADSKLNATYKKAMAALSRADKRVLLNEQRAWVDSRNKEAFAKHDKGSPAYLEMLAAKSVARENVLREKYLEKPVAQIPPKAGNIEPASSPASRPATRPTPEKSRVAPAPAPAPTPVETANAAPRQTQEDKRIVNVPAQKPRRNGRKIDITPKKFSASYNTLAHSFRAPSFPLVPAKVSSYGNDRTESYPITNGISIQFKYTNGSFEKPETITFLAHSFVGGTTAHRDDIAYALVGLLKTLSYNPAKDDKAKDAEIFGFMRSINNAFTSDSSRVWKNDGLVYVITYLKKNDMFAMVVNVDEKLNR